MTCVVSPDRKAIDTLKARAALTGAQLLEIEGDDGRPVLILTRWALTRSFTGDDLEALDRTLTLMGAPA